MNRLLKTILFALVAAVSLTGCHEDEPPVTDKPAEARTVLAIDERGNIYNLDGEVVTTLPDCESVTQIITEGNDYFVSGVNTKMKVGYWKNGKWNTLHVDFIDDVEHWTFGIAKWDYNIYLLDPPNVLKNSGIFRLEDSGHFNPALHGISVSEGNCYVVGTDYIQINELSYEERPILYYYSKGSYKKKPLPLPDGIANATATGIRAFDGNHYLACGYALEGALLWDDQDNVRLLPRLLDYPLSEPLLFPVTMASAVEKTAEHVYVAGVERTEQGIYLATIWTDNVPRHLVYASDTEKLRSALVVDIETYSNDLYVLTQETLTNSEFYSVIWLNGKPIAKLNNDLISLAIY